MPEMVAGWDFPPLQTHFQRVDFSKGYRRRRAIPLTKTSKFHSLPSNYLVENTAWSGVKYITSHLRRMSWLVIKSCQETKHEQENFTSPILISPKVINKGDQCRFSSTPKHESWQKSRNVFKGVKKKVKMSKPRAKELPRTAGSINSFLRKRNINTFY